MITRSANQKGRDSGSQLAVITGAATGRGYELARCCAAHGFDLFVCYLPDYDFASHASGPEGAHEALARMGPGAEGAVPALVAVLKDRDRDLQLLTIKTLGEIGGGAKAADGLLRPAVGPCHRVPLPPQPRTRLAVGVAGTPFVLVPVDIASDLS